MNLVIDSGNTSTKAGFFEEGKLRHFMKEITEENISSIIYNYRPGHILVSSVNNRFNLPETDIPVIRFTVDMPVPVKNGYRTPETLGRDRIAGVTGAQSIYPGEDCLVIDAGTTITLDHIKEDGTYEGGSIAPGIKMRLKALNAFTDRLPLTEFNDNPPLTGRTTEESIQSGVINGVVEEIKGMVRRYQEKKYQTKVILTGGDSLFLQKKFEKGIMTVPELVLIGLNRILEYNVAKKA